MQVFVPYSSPIEVARCLDAKRLNKQIIECQQIIDAILGVGKGWFNHPVVKMYSEYVHWLKLYMSCLRHYSLHCEQSAEAWSRQSLAWTPPFLTKEFCDQHKRRLYTKDKEFYSQFAKYGESEENWYFVDGEIVKYVNGKRI